jgi:hypothetical protein
MAGLVILAVAIVVAAGGTTYALQLEDRNAFCASCHTEPEAKYYQQSLDTNAATLAAFHAQKSVRCIDCHSGGGIFGRAKGLSQGTSDLLAYLSGHYHNPAITQNKLGDDSCTKCHANVMSGSGFDNHFHILLPRWQSVDPNAAHCVDCHTSHPAADSAQGYLATATVDRVCQNCHTAAGAGS